MWNAGDLTGCAPQKLSPESEPRLVTSCNVRSGAFLPACPPQHHRPPDRRMDVAAIAGSSARRSSVSPLDPRPRRHLLREAGPGGGGPGSARSPNSRPVTHGKFQVGEARRDVTPRVLGFLDPNQPTPSENGGKRVGNPLQPWPASFFTRSCNPGTQPRRGCGQRS